MKSLNPGESMLWFESMLWLSYIYNLNRFTKYSWAPFTRRKIETYQLCKCKQHPFAVCYLKKESVLEHEANQNFANRSEVDKTYLAAFHTNSSQLLRLPSHK